jgi:site-specific DNA recombinase
VHALIATDGIERRRETNDRQSEPVLLRGLLFTSDGERLVPSYTKSRRARPTATTARSNTGALAHGPAARAVASGAQSKNW